MDTYVRMGLYETMKTVNSDDCFAALIASPGIESQVAIPINGGWATQTFDYNSSTTSVEHLCDTDEELLKHGATVYFLWVDNAPKQGQQQTTITLCSKSKY
jgi:hypothetical protein